MCTNSTKLRNGSLVLAAVIFMSFGLSACMENLAKFKFSMPNDSQVELEVEVQRKVGIGLSGDFPIFEYGRIWFRPESSDSFFTFGFALNTSVFVKKTWPGLKEVGFLPTGASFPVWVKGSQIDLVIPKLNSPSVSWHFYFGVQGQLSVGVAGLIHALDDRIPDLSIGYDFVDDQGRQVLGIVFFGPAKDETGRVLVPGGIFVGSDISQFVFKAPVPSSTSSEFNSGRDLAQVNVALDMVEKFQRGEVLEVNGVVLNTKIAIKGKDAKSFKSKRKFKSLVNEFIQASHEAR
jgi:hypothetical protein